MIRLLIVADDLTGANDTAVQFSKTGVPTVVTVDRNIDMRAIDPQIAVLAVDTESRHTSPDEAAERVATVVRRAVEHGVTHVYKKTDSRLRGNIGAELEAAMIAAGHDRLMFVPAYPKTGRFTRGGRQYVGRDPVHTAALGRGPEALNTSSIKALIAEQSRVPVSVVPSSPEKVVAALKGGGEGISVFDCHSDRDLMLIARALADNDALGVVAGPAGLAEFLPDLLGLPRGPLPAMRSGGPMLVVNGSLTELALRQVAFARQHGFAEIVVPPSLLLASDIARSRELEDITEDAARRSQRPQDVVLRSIGHTNEVEAYIPQDSLAEADASRVRRLAAGNMGHVAARVLEMGSFGSCMVFGGDTSFGVLTALGCCELVVGDEIVPGVAAATLARGGKSLNFITKSGGFGPENVLEEVTNSLKGNARP